MFRAMGFDDEDLSSPIIGVPNPAADITPCNVHLDDVADAAIEGSTRRAGCRSSSGRSPSPTPSRWGPRG